MPISTSLRKLLCCAPVRQEEEEAEAPARRPLPEPAQAGPVQPGRPYRDFVEREAARFRREIEIDGSLDEPGQQEAAAALPALPREQRGSPGTAPGAALTREHTAVAAMQMHLVESGVIKPPYSRLEELPDHVEALIQLADDAGWLAREIPLPDHPAPQHAPVYYTTDPATGRPVPREDALIRGDYIFTDKGKRLTEADYIYPWQGAGGRPRVDDFTSRGWDACYSLEQTGDRVDIMVHQLYSFGILTAPIGTMSRRIEDFHFSPNPPQQTGDSASGRRERRGRGAGRTAASGTRGSGAGAAGMVYF